MAIRSQPSWRTRTSSPTRKEWAGFTRSPFTCTCPPRQAVAPAERVLASRTDQIQLSTRTVSPFCGPAASAAATAAAIFGSGTSSAVRPGPATFASGPSAVVPARPGDLRVGALGRRPGPARPTGLVVVRTFHSHGSDLSTRGRVRRVGFPGGARSGGPPHPHGSDVPVRWNRERPRRSRPPDLGLPCLPAAGRLAGGGGPDQAGRVRRLDVLGTAGARLRSGGRADADRRARAGRARREPYRADVHRRPFRGRAVPGAVRHRARLAADRRDRGRRPGAVRRADYLARALRPARQQAHSGGT